MSGLGLRRVADGRVGVSLFEEDPRDDRVVGSVGLAEIVNGAFEQRQRLFVVPLEGDK